MDGVNGVSKKVTFEAMEKPIFEALLNHLHHGVSEGFIDGGKGESYEKWFSALRGFLLDYCILDAIKIDEKLLNESNLFNHLAKHDESESFGEGWLRRELFINWVEKSSNAYAVAYRLGKTHAAVEINVNNAKRATNGRRLIGATSREKVRLEAANQMHLSKERAAAAMASIVNLDPGTIRRYLSELFPGNTWQQ